jgi:hypothetical protein
MGSQDVQHLTDGNDDLHVAWVEREGLWWVVGKLGSYGGDASKAKALQVAADAAASGGFVIRVYDKDGRFIGNHPAAKHASSQAFQDEVE